MSNEFYNASGYPANSDEGQASDLRAELLAIQAAMDKLPALLGKGNAMIVVNPGGTGLTSLPISLGTYQPVFTFTTVGNLTIVYSIQDGYYVRLGPLVLVAIRLQMSTFTHTTASGNAQISLPPGLAPTAVNNAAATMSIHGQGITKVNYTQVNGLINSVNTIQLVARGSAQAEVAITTADMPTGGGPSFSGSVIYRTDAP
mgnify:CR=1 FL=1